MSLSTSWATIRPTMLRLRSATPQNDQPKFKGQQISILEDAIRQDYSQVAGFGRYTFWHRKNL